MTKWEVDSDTAKINMSEYTLVSYYTFLSSCLSFLTFSSSGCSESLETPVTKTTTFWAY